MLKILEPKNAFKLKGCDSRSFWVSFFSTWKYIKSRNVSKLKNLIYVFVLKVPYLANYYAQNICASKNPPYFTHIFKCLWELRQKNPANLQKWRNYCQIEDFEDFKTYLERKKKQIINKIIKQKSSILKPNIWSNTFGQNIWIFRTNAMAEHSLIYSLKNV